MSKKINDEQFIKDYSVLTYDELSAKYNICSTTIANKKEKYNLDSKPKGRKKQKIVFKED